MTFLKDHLLGVVIIPLLLITAATSYYRFMVLEDYFVTYEIECDPATQSCFVGCENDDEEECAEPYYYALIERRAGELRERCGTNILGCDDAYECQAEVAVCEITFCDPETSDEDCFSENQL